MEQPTTKAIDYTMIQYPSLVKRIQSLFIDLLLILIVFTTSSLLISSISEIAISVKAGIFIFCMCLYEPMLVAFAGGTLGHKAMGIKIKSYNNPAKNISIFSAIGRVLIKASLGWISFITVTFNSEKRAIHDMMSGSVVLPKIKFKL